MEKMLIELNQVDKIYDAGDSRVDALRQVSLQVEKGEFIAIVGASGSGKSTLMNILGCLDIPTNGSYFLEQRDVSSLGEDELSQIRNRKIGFIFQGFHLIQSLTALENVELPLSYRGIRRADRRNLALQALERVAVAERANHLPAAMSGGQQQRVAIARAIAARPPIILADEPTGNLDTHVGAEVMSILLDLNKEGKTIILITHDPSIAKMAGRVVTVSDGTLI